MVDEVELPAEPKIFISYSWSSPDHQRWVVELAEGLAEKGIEVELDKWDLKPGHDADAFMESMVTDPTITKVLLICDEMYVAKSNGRQGGAGTEAQIITPQLYKQAQQDKFVAVVRERDPKGNAFLPAYYGSRIFIDLSGSSNPAEFDRLIRWIWHEPLDVRPVKGSKPNFVNADSQQMRTSTGAPLRIAVEAVKAGAPSARAVVVDYLELIAAGFEDFRIRVTDGNREVFDEVIYKSIEEFTPYRNELIELFSAIAKNDRSEEMAEVVHRFFEKIIPYMYRRPGPGQYTDIDFDNVRFIGRELFLYCLAIGLKFENFALAAFLLNNEYFWQNIDRSEQGSTHSYAIFDESTQSFEMRNRRLGTRKVSLAADLLRERNVGSGVDFNHILAADFVAYLRGRSGDSWRKWWPDTLLYVDHYAGPFEVFARAKSSRYFNRIREMLGVADVTHLQAELAAIEKEDHRNLPGAPFHRPNILRLANSEALATLP
jgi:TIR domain